MRAVEAAQVAQIGGNRNGQSTPMKPDTMQKTARAIALILRLSGNPATRKTVATEYAINAGMGKPAAVKLIDRLARKEGTA